jgi:ribosomal protein S11
MVKLGMPFFKRFVSAIAMFAFASAFQVTTQNVSAAPSLLDQCVSSINESGFTKEFILAETGFSDEAALLSAVSSGAWTIQISTGPGWNPPLRANSPDIYCGDSGDNTIDMLDSNPSGTHDFFFAGAGNDVVNTMWDSRYWGGSGNDTIHNNRERSIFYGGSGTNTCSNRESSGAYIAICDNSGGPALSQAALSLVDTTLTLGSTLTLSTSGGSGSGLVSFVVSSVGSAGCSLSGSVLSVTSSGTCTVTASKAADATYAAASSGAVTITASKRTQSALSLVDTALIAGSTLTLSTSGGSGSGLVSFVVSSAGSAGCSLSGAVLSVTSSGTCTVTASKAADATYAIGSSGAVTITVTAATTTTTSTTTTAPPALSIEIQAPVTTVAQGQASLATIAPTTTVSARRAQSTTTTTEVRLSTSAVVTTTTTLGPPKVSAVATGETAVQVDGVATKSKVTRENNQLVVSAGSLKATIGGLDKDGTALPLDSDGNVRLKAGDVVRVKLSGFTPGGTVEAWLFSTPVLMGSAVVRPDGSVIGNFKIPANTPNGSHRIVIVSKSKDGKPTSFTVGVVLGEVARSSTLTRVLIAIPIALAVAFGVILPNQLRRRRKVISQ